MAEIKTYTVVPSEPDDPEDSLRAMEENGEVFLFTGITVFDMMNTVAGFEATAGFEEALKGDTSIEFEKNRKEDDDGGK